MEKAFVSNSAFVRDCFQLNSIGLSETISGWEMSRQRKDVINTDELLNMNNIQYNSGFIKKENDSPAQYVTKETPTKEGEIVDDCHDKKPSWRKPKESASRIFSSDKLIKEDSFPTYSNLKSDEEDVASMKQFIDQLYDRMDDIAWGHFVDYVVEKKRHWEQATDEVIVNPTVNVEKEDVMEYCFDDAISIPTSDDLHHSVMGNQVHPNKISPMSKDKYNSNTSRKIHACSICMKDFPSTSRLTKHHLVHLTPEEKAKVKEGWKHPCYVCVKRFNSPSQLQRHLLIHTGEKPFRCDQCGQQYRYNSDLTVHKALHINPNLFSCDKCSKCFTQKCHLQTHEKIVHHKFNDVPCPECNKNFKE